jgi:hypothetical protein
MSRDIFLRRLGADTFLSRHSAQPFERALAIGEWSCSGDVVSCFVSSHETLRSLFLPVVPLHCRDGAHSFLETDKHNDCRYRGQVGGAACTGWHGDSGQGTPLGPDLLGKKWLWSDSSYAGIAKTITDGVSNQKHERQLLFHIHLLFAAFDYFPDYRDSSVTATLSDS